jgi:Delta7-sterol 5-desaturase
MIQELVNSFLTEYNYIQIFGLVVVYFLLLYFGLGYVFLRVCKFLNKKNILHKIVDKEVSENQIRREMKHSFVSIVIFGFTTIPLILLIRNGYILLLPDSFFNVVWGLLLLSLWNEVHFFVIHRIMHIPIIMKHIHYVHHKSVIPTVYSVFSIHWVEAILLSTVPITLAPFISLSAYAIFLYPIVSILLNFSGHCNYRFGNGNGADWVLLGTHHNAHHNKFTGNFGFALNFLDKLHDIIRWLISSKNKK